MQNLAEISQSAFKITAKWFLNLAAGKSYFMSKILPVGQYLSECQMVKISWTALQLLGFEHSQYDSFDTELWQSSSSRACLRRHSRCHEFPPSRSVWARQSVSPVGVASPRFIGRRSASTVLSQDCFGRPILHLQVSGGPAMQAWRARWWSCQGSAR